MSITTYAELQTAVANWLYGRTDLTSRITEFISNFESYFVRRCQLRRMVERDQDTSFSAEYTALPTGFREMRSLHLIDSAARHIVLHPVSMEWLDDNVDMSTTGVPKYYLVVGDELRVGPPPDATYTAEMTYIQFPVLSVSATSNWLLAQHQDIYLYGALMEAAPFLGSDERVPVWQAQRDSRIADLLVAEKRAAFSGGVLQVRSDLALGRLRGSIASG